jgi:hypothetical protein
MRQSENFQAAQVATIEQLKIKNENQACEIRHLNALLHHHEQDLSRARRQAQQDASSKDGIANALANMTAEYDTAQTVLGDVLKLTIANRSSDRDIEHGVRELMNQVEQLQSANAGLQEKNRIQAATLLDLRQKSSDAAQNADLQEKQQRLLN